MLLRQLLKLKAAQYVLTVLCQPGHPCCMATGMSPATASKPVFSLQRPRLALKCRCLVPYIEGSKVQHFVRGDLYVLTYKLGDAAARYAATQQLIE